MSTTLTFTNPTQIIRQEGHNYIRFNISKLPGAKSGFYNRDDLKGRTKLHPQLRVIAQELDTMDSIENFHINVGGEQPDRIVVRFKPHIIVDDGVLTVIADIIGERLG